MKSFFASTLNHLSGFRIKPLRNRNWDDVLYEPLQRNRNGAMPTLEANCGRRVTAGKPLSSSVYAAESRTLGRIRSAWYDLKGPRGEREGRSPLQMQKNLCVWDQLRKFSPAMADLRCMLWKNAGFEGGK